MNQGKGKQGKSKQARVIVEQFETVVVEGHRLDIITRPVDPGKHRWLLAVENERGIRSVWMEWFNSAAEALEAGRRAVFSEGPESFLDVEGFEYMVKEDDAPDFDDISLH